MFAPFMPHQLTGAAFLAPRGFALLADGMGLGKSASSILAADKIGAEKILVFCPAAVRNTWAREFDKWQNPGTRSVTVLEGRPQESPGDGVTIASHDSLSYPASAAHLRAGAPYDIIIADELHNFRTMDAERTKMMLGPYGAWTWAKRFWGLTGTPMVNSSADLWPIVFGPMRQNVAWWDFCVKYANMQPSFEGPKPVGIKNAGELADLLRPHFLRRTLESVGITLPPLMINHVPMAIPPAALSEVMAGLEDWTPARLHLALENNDELRDAALARVRQALGLAKAHAVATHVHSLLMGGHGPAVVFFQHTAVRKALYGMLGPSGSKFQVSWIDGKITRPQLAAAESWFQAGKLDILLVQLQAGSTGLTLHRSNRVVVAELPWTAMTLHQAVKRCHRLGTKYAVTAEVMRAQGCWLEDILATTVARKHLAAETLLGLLTSSS